MATDIEQQAFVLHRRPYRETSLLVTFFTPDYGKQNAVIKGVRSSSKTARAKQAWLQPFQGLNISWREKTNHSSDLVSLRQLEPNHVRFPLGGEGSICGLYLNELLYRLLYPSLEVTGLFEEYQQALYDLALAEDRYQQAWVLRQFEFALLSELGYAFQTEVDYYQQPIQADKKYLFHLELGLFPEPFSQISLDQNQGVVISGQCLLLFAQKTYCESCLTEWKRLFRYVLTPYLGQKPIQTRSLFQS
ncbi:DNA repair protein RecO [Hydrogenovibrio crunogenus]|uniref:DNA repair protein RecO n=1 Tax=Hydrogenovibrio crunogenus TaxID=39765 RepID=A0A4P7NY68_9GAMM|nr:DNA repair protein RecO [Hydrogenovibrio crunogenus]QBZ82697.1 DNA repair protein RecO [Hydrogenovibrio crunogenus]